VLVQRLNWTRADFQAALEGYSTRARAPIVAARPPRVAFQPAAARQARESPDFAIAIHESAHAICGIARGIRVAHAVLSGPRGDPTGGYVTEGRLVPVEAELAFFDSSCFCADDEALPALPKDPLSTLIYHAAGNVCWTVLGIHARSDSDARYIERLAGVTLKQTPYVPCRGYSKPVRRLVQLMDHEARGLVTYNFEWIARVAARLVERRRVSGAEIRALRPDWQAFGRGTPQRSINHE
jgi:hypothetical protein